MRWEDLEDNDVKKSEKRAEELRYICKRKGKSEKSDGEGKRKKKEKWRMRKEKKKAENLWQINKGSIE